MKSFCFDPSVLSTLVTLAERGQTQQKKKLQGPHGQTRLSSQKRTCDNAICPIRRYGADEQP